MSHARSAALLSLLALLALTGCGPVNAGSSRAEELRDRFEAEPDVVEVSVNGDNPLPFAGSVRGWVTAEAGISDTRLCELVHAVAEFQSSRDVTWEVVLETGPWGVAVSDERSVNDERCARLAELRAEPSLTGATLTGELTAAAVEADADPVEAFDEAAALLGAEGAIAVIGVPVEGTFRPSDEIAFEPGWRFSVWSEEDGGRPEEAIAAYDAVAGIVPVESADLAPGSASLVIPSFSEYERAELAVAPLRSTSLEVSISSLDVAVLAEPSADVLSLAEQLSEHPSVGSLRIGSDHVSVLVTSTDAVPAVESTLASLPEAAAVTVDFAADDGLWTLYGTAEERAARLPLVEAAVGTGVVESVLASARLEVAPSVDSDQALAALGGALSTSVPDGTEVQLMGGDIGFRFTAAHPLDEVETFRDGDPGAFVDAWNGD